MTKLLRQAISEIEKLSPEQQDAIASRLLEELQDEQKWSTRFNSTTDEQWDRMAEMVRQEINDDETVLLDDFLSTEK
ncbi:hypothetical protein IQ255_11325 [Pleurocapsales cyanobacterium LEGE 10410]|nr:hypothetical protein [Pleurocapsales cyanobacterium LEGE 10410]